MKINKVLSTVFVVFVIAAMFVSVAYAADRRAAIYGVKITSRPLNGLMISGRTSCQPVGYGNNAYAVTSIDGAILNVTVYEKAPSPKTKCRPSTFSLTVKPALVSGQTYSVYVNNQYRFSMTAR